MGNHEDMFRKLTILLLLSLTLGCGKADEPTPDEMAAGAREGMKLEPYLEQLEKGEVEERKLIILGATLASSRENHIHRLRGENENETLTHKEGHAEAVYDKDGKLIEEGINAGSYNYADPWLEPLEHFAFDIHPWILWGNFEGDPTSIDERIDAYMLDLKDGLTKELELRDKIQFDAEYVWNKPGQPEAIAIFFRAIEAGDADRLFALFDEDSAPPSEEAIDEVIANITSGFKAIYPDE